MSIENLEENMTDFSVRTVPADGLGLCHFSGGFALKKISFPF